MMFCASPWQALTKGWQAQGGQDHPWSIPALWSQWQGRSQGRKLLNMGLSKMLPKGSRTQLLYAEWDCPQVVSGLYMIHHATEGILSMLTASRTKWFSFLSRHSLWAYFKTECFAFGTHASHCMDTMLVFCRNLRRGCHLAQSLRLKHPEPSPWPLGAALC